MWILVLIVISGSQPVAVAQSTHESMDSCFEGRDQLLVERRAYDGHLPPGVQAICMQAQ